MYFLFPRSPSSRALTSSRVDTDETSSRAIANPRAIARRPRRHHRLLFLLLVVVLARTFLHSFTKDAFASTDFFDARCVFATTA